MTTYIIALVLKCIDASHTWGDSSWPERAANFRRPIWNSMSCTHKKISKKKVFNEIDQKKKIEKSTWDLKIHIDKASEK